jgi:quercetin dioxygenase-like cupin family protein
MLRRGYSCCFLSMLSFVAFCVTSASAQPVGQVDRKGIESKTKLEAVLSGYLTELNGKYKLRVSELTFQPGGYVGEHHHLAPGMRVVTSGELTFIQPDKTTIYKTGDTFYESGDVTHVAKNLGGVPLTILSFELVPVDLKGSTQVLPKAK